MALSLSACGIDSSLYPSANATGAGVNTASVTEGNARSANHAPTITGTSGTVVSVGSKYSFTPVAVDVDGDVLVFSIANKPSWATFNTLTGALTGTPTTAGTYPNVEISVSDGMSSVSLSAFTLTVGPDSTGSAAMQWTVPTQNTDGSPLTDLAGYRIYYGTSSTSLDHSVDVNPATITSYTIAGLSRGVTYYFAIASVNTAGVSSDISSVISKTI